jgi:hypothetical protein
MSIALSSFAPASQATVEASDKSTSLLLSTTGTPTIALLTNTSWTAIMYVLLGGSGVVATIATGTPIMPGASLPLTIGANTELAVICNPGNSGGLSVTLGS